jgi:hypothetical protein
MSRPLFVVRHQGLYVFWKNRSPAFRFPFTDLHVPVLTSRLHCSEAALQFAENTTFMFLRRVNVGTFITVEVSKTSFRCRGSIVCSRMYNTGTRMEP